MPSQNQVMARISASVRVWALGDDDVALVVHDLAGEDLQFARGDGLARGGDGFLGTLSAVRGQGGDVHPALVHALEAVDRLPGAVDHGLHLLGHVDAPVPDGGR